MSDERLIKETLSGNTEAFGILMGKYQNRLYNLAIHLVDSPDDAQDIVQETFCQAFGHLSQFRGACHFYTWLYRIAYNNAITCLRERKRLIPFGQVSENYGETLSDTRSSPDHGFHVQETADLLWQAIARLPLEYRIPIILREMEDASYEEIAEILAIPIGTVRSRLHRARNMLCNMLSAYKKDLT